MSDYHVAEIPIKHHRGNYWSHWEVYDRTPALSIFCDNFSHEKKMSLYSEEARGNLVCYQGVNSRGDGLVP